METMDLFFSSAAEHEQLDGLWKKHFLRRCFNLLGGVIHLHNSASRNRSASEWENSHLKNNNIEIYINIMMETDKGFIF